MTLSCSSTLQIGNTVGGGEETYFLRNLERLMSTLEQAGRSAFKTLEMGHAS